MASPARLLVPLMALLSLVAAAAAAPPDAAEIERLVRQLGSDDRAQRQEAGKRLEAIGEPALEALRQAAAARDADADVRLRACLVLRAITTSSYAEVLTIQGQPGYWLNRVAFTSDGKQVLATGGAVIWYDLAAGKEVRRVLEVQFARNGLALSADGKLFLTCHQNEHVVRLGEVETGKEVMTFRNHSAGVHGVALSGDGKLAASGGDDRSLRLWDVKTGEELRQMKAALEKVRCLAFSPDDKLLASGHVGNPRDGLLRLWDPAKGEPVRSLPGHLRDVTAVRFLPDGKLLSAGMDGKLFLWDAATGKELLRMEHAGGIYDAAVSPDGKRALSAGWEDKAVRLWDLETGKELHRFDGHTTHVLGVAFSPDGKRAVSSDAACTVRVWRVAK